ncbi:MAG: acylphosphatase [Thiomonas sp.]
MTCKRARVRGRVQGVAFRAHTREQALRLGLRGYARNLPDGTVEVLVCGPQRDVDALLRWLWQGSPAARVDAVTVEDAADADCGNGFAVG